MPNTLTAISIVELPARRLNRRGGKLRQRHAATGNLADLDRAIVAIEKAATLVERGSPNKPIYLTNLGRALRSQYQATRRREDIDRAVKCLEEGVALTAADSPDRVSRLDALARAVEDRAGAGRRA